MNTGVKPTSGGLSLGYVPPIKYKTEHYHWFIGTGLLAVAAGLTVGAGAHLPLLAAALLLALAAITTRDHGFCLTLIGVALCTMSGIRLGPLIPADVFLLPAAMITVILVVRRLSLPHWWSFPLFGIFLVGVTSIVVTPNSARSPFELLQFIGLTAVVPLVIAVQATSERRRYLLAGAFVLSAVVSGTFGILDATGVSDVARSLTGFQGIGGRATGLTNHSNLLGLSSAMAAPFVLYLARQRRWWIMAMPVLVFSTLVSGSRSGIIAFGVGVLLATVSSRRAALRAVVTVAVAALTIYIVGRLGYTAGLDRLLGGEASATVSDAVRADQADMALQDIRDHPLAGVGFSGDDQAHSLYLEVARSGGLVSLALYLWLAAGAVLTGWKRRADGLMAASTASFAAFLVAAVQHNTLNDRFLIVPLGFIVAAAIKQRRDS
ncbi:MAG: O-antigen ligase family protein [Actinomycetota bacterium]|nr:O-antigen ligase family protein [Actinomycetota bacterium]